MAGKNSKNENGIVTNLEEYALVLVYENINNCQTSKCLIKLKTFLTKKLKSFNERDGKYFKQNNGKNSQRRCFIKK